MGNNLFNFILNKSNSYNYYKKEHEKLVKENNNLKKQVSSLNNRVSELERNIQAPRNFPGRFLTKNDVLTKFGDDTYYDSSRWDKFYQEMVEVLSRMDDVHKILEFGPYKAPLIENEDVIDHMDRSEFFPFGVNKVIVHDCTKFPYPIKDKEYDLVILSQVLEHFGIMGEQNDVFKELARISKRAIIGLPYKWFSPSERDHHMIDEKVFDAWQGEYKYSYQNINTKNQTILRIYDFD
ncbi:hypothetical protein BGI41_04105 [Methanobrevibacter sp. 87.7]|uniref:class I SAM-dependent methyltransferase n=1 Tax=Methanobrevibacter sp. 87.7 TaxID=387957 RepID=UPI000B507854|nr:class I SAM-dependent methyltransferase [Methanobrevibacter sp. 87.7]OWT33115.1 hypothetical protein BGI41_04105 [Methanobrevibacter sp. 87.7]